MSTAALDKLVAQCCRPDGPALLEVETLGADEVARFSAALAAQHIRVLELDGAQLKNKTELLHAVAKVFAFPGYFGHNWDALLDCWSDLSWLPAAGWVCLFLNAASFRAAEPAAYKTLLTIAQDAAQRWHQADPKAVFKLVSVTTSDPSITGKEKTA